MSEPNQKSRQKPLTRTNIYLHLRQLEWIQQQAKDEGTTKAEIVRRAIDFYMGAQQLLVEPTLTEIQRLTEIEELHRAETEEEKRAYLISLIDERLEEMMNRVVVKLDLSFYDRLLDRQPGRR